MSKYTTQLRFICESEAGYDESEGYMSINQIIAKAREKIFSFEYPIFDESYRSVLETKILKHFYTREIGAETYGRWKLFLDSTMNEIMPYYNLLYKSTLLEFNPFYDVDYTRKGSKDINGDEVTKGNTKSVLAGNTEDSTVSNGTSNTSLTDNTDYTSDNDTTVTGNSTSYSLFSDTPQGGLTGVDEEKYLTTAKKDTVQSTNVTDGSIVDHTERTGNSETTKNDTVTSNGTTNSTNDTTSNDHKNITNNETYLEHVYGKMGSGNYSELITKYRKTFLNIDVEIIGKLEELFIQLW